MAGARPPGFFTDDDLRGVFSLFDPTGKGKISENQVITGLKALGIDAGESGLAGAGAGEGKESEDAAGRAGA